MARVYVVGTADTKGAELAYLADAVREAGVEICVVDVGTRAPIERTDISASEVAGHHPRGADGVLAGDDRGEAVSAMGAAFARFMASRDDVAGIVGIGGGGGTSIVTAGMRELPIGVPKVMVSTLASGDVAPYVGVSDIMMMPSITDMAGLNRLSRIILANVGRAVAAMASGEAPDEANEKPAVGLTMFGVTTEAVMALGERLEADHECMVFHATGTGGRTMEKLAASGMLSGLIDLTTTEVCDLLCGGVLAAQEDRFDVVAETRLPYIGSVGALDMVNFWAPETIPEKFADRLFYRHNPNVTLMRTTAEECRKIGEWIGRKLDRCEGPVLFLIPERGVSALDTEGGAFWNPDADAALFDAIENSARWTGNRRLGRLPLHINDSAFADAVAAAWREMTQR